MANHLESISGDKILAKGVSHGSDREGAEMAN
jgi:hypothetical protein